MFKKVLSIRFHDQQINIGIFILRVCIAMLLIVHSCNLLSHLTERQDSFIELMGLNNPITIALALSAELICAILLLVGLGTRLILVPLIVTMSASILIVHQCNIFETGTTAFLYVTGFVVLFIIGAGKYSVDSFFSTKEKTTEIPIETNNKREDRSENFEVGGEG